MAASKHRLDEVTPELALTPALACQGLDTAVQRRGVRSWPKASRTHPSKVGGRGAPSTVIPALPNTKRMVCSLGGFGAGSSPRMLVVELSQGRGGKVPVQGPRGGSGAFAERQALGESSRPSSHHGESNQGLRGRSDSLQVTKRPHSTPDCSGIQSLVLHTVPLPAHSPGR